MRVNAAELNAIKSLAASQLTVSRLSGFEGKDQIVKQTKQAKKVWWTTIRSRYRLDSAKKYSVELDGDDAGQLRFKKGGKVNGSRFASLTDAQRNVPDTTAATGIDASKNACADVLKSMNDAFAKAGIPFELKSK
jgi:hypothetical protein